jgi:hypothetical protein
MPLWIRQLFTRRRRYEDLSVSIREHLEERIDELTDGGMDRRAAEQKARREFGNIALIEERSREVWQWRLLESLWADARYALRQIRRSPGYAATVIGTLAVGIGSAAAMFTVVDHVLLRPTRYPDAGRLVALEETNSAATTYSWPAPWLDIEQWRAQGRSFSAIEFSARLPGRNYLNGDVAAPQVDGERVSPNLFRMLGVHPALGRDFDLELHGSTMLLMGVALGTALALASGRLVGGFLYGVSAHDGTTLVAAAMLLLSSGLTAAYLPARRAAGADPMEALRAE